MEKGKVVFIRCVFLRGGFPSERVFVIRFEGEAELRGVAPAQYCYTQEREPLGDEPADDGEIDGLVLGVVVGSRDGRVFRVHLPDGEVYDLDRGHIVPVQAGDDRHVSVKS